MNVSGVMEAWKRCWCFWCFFLLHSVWFTLMPKKLNSSTASHRQLFSTRCCSMKTRAGANTHSERRGQRSHQSRLVPLGDGDRGWWEREREREEAWSGNEKKMEEWDLSWRSSTFRTRWQIGCSDERKHTVLLNQPAASIHSARKTKKPKFFVFFCVKGKKKSNKGKKQSMK